MKIPFDNGILISSMDINFFSNHFPPKCGPPLTFQWILYFTRGAMHHRSNYECQFCIMRLVRARVTGFSFSSVLSRLVDLKFSSHPTPQIIYPTLLPLFLPLALPLPRNTSLVTFLAPNSRPHMWHQHYCQARVRSPKVKTKRTDTKITWATTP